MGGEVNVAQQHDARTPFEIFTVDGLYDDAEIQEFFRYIRQDCGDAKKFSHESEFKNGKVLDPATASKMYDKIKAVLPGVYVDATGVEWTFEGPCRYVMFAEIHEGQLFGIHTDTGSEYDRDTGAMSKFTVLTYLNDGFSGGHTVFYDDHFRRTVDVTPVRNRTLIFDIDLFHSGQPVESGTKYWIGTELVCRRK